MSVALAPLPQSDAELTSLVVVADQLAVRGRIADALQDAGVIVRGSFAVSGVATCPFSPQLLVFGCGSVLASEDALLRQFRRRYPAARIVLVCDSGNGRSIRRALNGGVEGLVLTDELERTLPSTVAAVWAGQRVTPAEIRPSVAKPALSFREKQILGMVVMGFTNGQIGARLFLAESTVKSHLSSAFTKLGVRSRSEAAALILDPEASVGLGILGITERVPSARRAAD